MKSVIFTFLTRFCYCRKKSMSGFLLLGKGKASFSLPSRIHNYILRLWIRAPMLGRDCNAVQVIDLGAPQWARWWLLTKSSTFTAINLVVSCWGSSPSKLVFNTLWMGSGKSPFAFAKPLLLRFRVYTDTMAGTRDNKCKSGRGFGWITKRSSRGLRSRVITPKNPAIWITT